MRRTQARLGSQNKPTVHYSAYFTVPSYFVVFLFAVFGKLMQTLCNYSWGRWALLKYPRVFSYGLFSREGPTEQQMAQTRFQMNFVGDGYSKGESHLSLTVIICQEKPDTRSSLMWPYLRQIDPKSPYPTAESRLLARPLTSSTVWTLVSLRRHYATHLDSRSVASGCSHDRCPSAGPCKQMRLPELMHALLSQPA